MVSVELLCVQSPQPRSGSEQANIKEYSHDFSRRSWGRKLRDKPKECFRRRLDVFRPIGVLNRFIKTFEGEIEIHSLPGVVIVVAALNAKAP